MCLWVCVCLCACVCFCVSMRVHVCVCVCVCVWLLPHQKCQHCYTYLFMGSLLSPVVAQGDHLQSHLHNDNNRVTRSECVVCECASGCMCGLYPHVLSSPHLTHCHTYLDNSSLPYHAPDFSLPCSCPVLPPSTERPHTCPGLTLWAHRKLPGHSPL